MEDDAYERFLVLLALGDEETSPPLDDDDEVDAIVATAATMLAKRSASSGHFAEAVVWQQIADASPAKVNQAASIELAIGLRPPEGSSHASGDRAEPGSWSIDPDAAGRRRHG